MLVFYSSLGPCITHEGRRDDCRKRCVKHWLLATPLKSPKRVRQDSDTRATLTEEQGAPQGKTEPEDLQNPWETWNSRAACVLS